LNRLQRRRLLQLPPDDYEFFESEAAQLSLLQQLDYDDDKRVLPFPYLCALKFLFK
jgi:hypothetical protein